MRDMLVTLTTPADVVAENKASDVWLVEFYVDTSDEAVADIDVAMLGRRHDYSATFSSERSARWFYSAQSQASCLERFIAANFIPTECSIKLKLSVISSEKVTVVDETVRHVSELRSIDADSSV